MAPARGGARLSRGPLSSSRVAVKGKTCVEIQFKLDDKIGVTFTNSSVLERQLDTFKDMMPFEASIKKIHNYYTFT